MAASVSVIILTRNEERNLGYALASVCDWAAEVFVVDSFSTDDTTELVRRFNCALYQHAFANYSDQRNWALQQLPIRSEWVLFLDADEWLPGEIKKEIGDRIGASPPENGFYINRRLMWMGKWVRHGYYPTWLLRLFRRGKGRCEERVVNEHIIVEGRLGYLSHDFVHEDRNPISRWVEKHDRYASAEARLLLKETGRDTGKLWGNGQAGRKRWVRVNIWRRMPVVVRPAMYFGYRYLARGGFLDGRAGLAYHVLQGLYFPLLIDLKYLELIRDGDGGRKRGA